MKRLTLPTTLMLGSLVLVAVGCSDTTDETTADVNVLSDGSTEPSDASDQLDAASDEDGAAPIEDGLGPDDVTKPETDVTEPEDDTEVAPIPDAEDDATEDDATESDATEDDATESDATEDDATESDATESDATESDATEDDATESDATESDATEGDDTDDGPVCSTIAELRAAGEGPVDMTLCDVAVTVVYDSGYYVQEVGGDAMNIYVGLQFDEEGQWPYAAPLVGDILTVAVSEYGSFGGHQEVLASDTPTVTGTTSLDDYFLDLSSGIEPAEELESRLVKLSGATVNTAMGDTLSVSYGEASDVQVYLSGTVQVCEGAIIDISKAVITEYNGVHQVKVFGAESYVTVIDTTECLSQDYNWDFEDWTSSDPPAGFIKTDGGEGFTVTQESTDVHGGASSARVTVTGTDAIELAQVWYMDLAETDTVSFSLWVHDNDPNLKARIVLKFYDGTQEVDGDGEKYSPYTEDSADWAQLIVTRAVPEGATQVRGFARFYDMAEFSTAGSATMLLDDWYVDMGQAVEEPPVDPPTDPACSSIQELKASEQGPVDLLLCDVVVTQTYYSGYFVQQLDGEAMDIYVGSQTDDEGQWPYPQPMVGDVLNIPVTEYGSFNGHEEVMASGAPTKTGTASLDAYYLDLSEGIVPSESLESRLVKLSGAKVTDVQGDILTVDYGTATDVLVYLSGTVQICKNAIIDIAHGIILQYGDIHEVKVYDAAENVTIVDSSGCLAQDYNWGFEDWSESNPPLGFVKTDNGDELEITQETGSVYTGESAAKLTLQTTANAEMGQLYYMSLSGAPEVTLSAWTLDNDPNVRARLVLKFYDGTKEVGTGEKYSVYTEDSADWTQLSVTRPVPEDAIQARGYIRLYDTGDFEAVGSGSLTIDDWFLAL